MENLFYIPIIKDGDEFFQTFVLDDDELANYHFRKYKNIIENYFIRDEAIVNLKTGRFKTFIYKPKDSSENIYFCPTNDKGYPNDDDEITIEEDRIEELKDILTINARRSEGIYKDQVIDIFLDFVTPKIKLLNNNADCYYDSRHFHRSCIIFGAPGAGKTTMLRKLTLDLASNSLEENKSIQKLPIYIQLRDFNNYSNDFNSYIENCIANTLINTSFINTRGIRNGSNLCLLLDGADEIDFEKFSNFENTISLFKQKNPLTSLIITSRPDKKLEKISGFNKCYIQPFNNEQIKELTYRKLAKGGRWKEFVSIVNTVPEVHEILKNPLMLTISHFLFTHKSIVPLNSGQLIKELVAALVDNWDSQRNIERKLENKKVSAIEITNFLGKMSLFYSEQKKSSLPSHEIFKYIKDFEKKEELDLYLEYISFATGILKQSDDGNWLFRFKAMQDYFCSSYLVEGVNKISNDLFIQKDWNKILMMISGLNSDPNYILNYILNSHEIDTTTKVANSLSIINQSHSLTKNDIQTSFQELENFFINFENVNKISKKHINVDKKNMSFSLPEQVKGIEQIISLMKTLFQIRYTKYEYNFYGYLKKSKSNLLNSIALLDAKNGQFEIGSSESGALIKFREESPEIPD